MTLLAGLTAILDWIGLVVFAATGALVASRKQMDIVGFALLATVTGIGGGSLRDVLLGSTPVGWVQRPASLVVCLIVAVLVFFTAHILQSRLKALLWLDAAGLALFAVTGAEIALLAGSGNIAAVTMGVVTATFGGVIRDILGGETPVILSREIYVTAALLAATTFVGCRAAGVEGDISVIGGIAAGFVLRAAALHWGWSLPRYRERPGR
jgi:uncharacterized membrane protein YeiH